TVSYNKKIMRKSIEEKVSDLFTRSVDRFIDPDNQFQEKLLAKARGEYDKDIIIKLGVDPTKPDIHLGHAVSLRKLRAMQDMGAKVVFLIGDFTARIGDPTGKSKVRPELEQEAIEYNLKTYLDQVGKILRLDPDVFAWIRNSDWFDDLSDLVAPEQTLKGEADGRTISLTFPAN